MLSTLRVRGVALSSNAATHCEPDSGHRGVRAVSYTPCAPAAGLAQAARRAHVTGCAGVGAATFTGGGPDGPFERAPLQREQRAYARLVARAKHALGRGLRRGHRVVFLPNMSELCLGDPPRTATLTPHGGADQESADRGQIRASHWDGSPIYRPKPPEIARKLRVFATADHSPPSPVKPLQITRFQDVLRRLLIRKRSQVRVLDRPLTNGLRIDSDAARAQSGQVVEFPAATYDLVIFDCDGVLVDSEVISNGVLARMLTREGVPACVRLATRRTATSAHSATPAPPRSSRLWMGSQTSWLIARAQISRKHALPWAGS